MNKPLFEALEELEKKQGIPETLMLAKIEEAITRACQKEFGGKTLSGQNSEAKIEVIIDPVKKDLKVYLLKEVVAELTDPVTQVTLEEAREHNKRITVGKILKTEIKPNNIHRMSAKAAKDVIIQGIREAEKENARREFENKKEEIVTATVRKIDKTTGDAELETDTGLLVLQYRDRIPDEDYRPGQKLKVYVRKVTRRDGHVDIRVSRSDANFIRCLFRLEVPEIEDGTVVIKHVAREAGSRTKIAVFSTDESVDPIGTCVGPRGMRISSILSDLSGEKVDIIKYSDDITEYVRAALSPATVISVELVDEKSTEVTVSPDQLSLAIGKEGQNARLAAKLTSCKIDIKAG